MSLIRNSIWVLLWFGAWGGVGAAGAKAQDVPDPTVAAADSVESPPDSLLFPRWNLDTIVKLSATRAGYHNWAKGGVNTLATTTGIDFKALRTSLSWQQTHEVHLAFGIVKQDTLDLRKAEDEIRVHLAWQHRGEDVFRYLQPTLALQIRTQFAPGFNYKKNPFTDLDPDNVRLPPVKVSDFLSPLVITQSVGLSYNPAPWFAQRLGIGSKETIVGIERFRALYGLEPEEWMEIELGVESRTELDREIWQNVRLKSTLGLFAAFNKPDLPDLQWENLVEMKVNSWLGVNFQVDTLYDRDINNRIQVKEMLSLGLSFALI